MVQRAEQRAQSLEARTIENHSIFSRFEAFQNKMFGRKKRGV
jgi:hypothetical protein